MPRVNANRLKDRLDKLPYESLQKFYDMYKKSSSPSPDILSHTLVRMVSLKWGLDGKRYFSSKAQDKFKTRKFRGKNNG
jgi:hypothetical protein|tara:strand:- start:190 stop:426 length:237 start_codon:yes stop_codon:yes gene_type:complete